MRRVSRTPFLGVCSEPLRSLSPRKRPELPSSPGPGPPGATEAQGSGGSPVGTRLPFPSDCARVPPPCSVGRAAPTRPADPGVRPPPFVSRGPAGGEAKGEVRFSFSVAPPPARPAQVIGKLAGGFTGGLWAELGGQGPEGAGDCAEFNKEPVCAGGDRVWGIRGALQRPGVALQPEGSRLGSWASRSQGFPPTLISRPVHSRLSPAGHQEHGV